MSKFFSTETEVHKIYSRWALTKWGDKFSAAEVDDEFEIDDDGVLDGKAMCSLFVAGGILTLLKNHVGNCASLFTRVVRAAEPLKHNQFFYCQNVGIYNAYFISV
jgi:hypothetical protein